MTNLLEIVSKLKAELDAFRPLSNEVEQRIMQKFRLDWNYHSNHLEGNSLNYGETKALLLFGITAQGKPLKDHLEITGHNEAINWILDLVKQEIPITENFIRELHTLLLKESYEKKSISQDGKTVLTRRIEVGKYKTQPNHVLTQTGEIFYFATPEETPAKMHDLMLWFRKKSQEKDLNSISLAAEFHYKFIRIHPFDDGNGRTARILMNFILMQFGFPPVIIKTEDKENYFRVLQLADAGNLEPFKEYIALNLIHSLELMIKGAKGENIDDKDDLDKELALLEQKFNPLGGVSKKTKNLDSIREILDDSINHLFYKFEEIYIKFSKFYIETTFNIRDFNYTEVNHPSHLLYDASIYNLNNIDIDNTCQLYSSFRLLKNENIEDLFIEYYINIIFSKFMYSIELPYINNHYLIHKAYNEQLTDDEIDEIIKIISQEHIKFIEDKLKNK